MDKLKRLAKHGMSIVRIAEILERSRSAVEQKRLRKTWHFLTSAVPAVEWGRYSLKEF